MPVEIRIQFSSSAHRTARQTERTNPRNETLVKATDTTTSPDRRESLYHGLRAVRRHLRLDDFERLPKRRNFKLKGRVCGIKKCVFKVRGALERVPCS
jgi:hypothetical protein